MASNKMLAACSAAAGAASLAPDTRVLLQAAALAMV
jgi:hypothetical protein